MVMGPVPCRSENGRGTQIGGFINAKKPMRLFRVTDAVGNASFWEILIFCSLPGVVMGSR